MEDEPLPERHGHFMHEALAEARLALAENEVPVGCVIVHNDTDSILARGRNRTNIEKDATRHAELVAYDALLHANEYDVEAVTTLLRASTLYVTVEPCIMCAYALRLMGLTEVHFGCRNDRFGGCGSVVEVHTTGSTLNTEAASVVSEFYWLLRRSRVLYT